MSSIGSRWPTIEQALSKKRRGKNSGEKRKNGFRLRHRYLLLTYSQIDPEKLPYQAIVDRIHSLKGECTVAIEDHKELREGETDLGVHYHVFCVAETMFSSRTPRFLDINGYHPNIQLITYEHAVAWDYCIKDGNILHNGVPEPPNPRLTKKQTLDEVYQEAMAAANSEQMLRIIRKKAPYRFCTNFPALKSAAAYVHPGDTTTAYSSPEGLLLWIERFPDVRDWIQRYLPSYQFQEGPGQRPAGIITDIDEVIERPPSPRSLSGPDREGSEVASSCSDSGFAESLDSELRYESEGEKEAQRRQSELRRPQARPKSLILWGGTRLGKTLFARALGRHSHFGGLYNMNEYDEGSEYAIFDDLRTGLTEFDYKNWLGGQHQFVTTDKYRHKRTVTWGRPCIYISNYNPFDVSPSSIDLDWLRGNTVCVNVEEPMCNLAEDSQ